MKTWLQTAKGTYGYFIIQVWHNTETDEYETDRLKDYQFSTKAEAIKDFESWRGDHWEPTEISRTWDISRP
jgi:hypothetical protein